jgi:uncharacterized protein DUF6644
MLLAFFKWCEASWLGKGISGSVYLFPVVEAVHLLALAVIGGAVLIVDMRLAGLGLKKTPAAEVAREAEPWLLWSLGIMLISGFMLMCSEAMRCYYNGAFWLKMYSLLAAMIFTFTIRRSVARAATAPGTSMKMILVALISVLLWSGVGLGGRGIGFY